MFFDALAQSAAGHNLYGLSGHGVAVASHRYASSAGLWSLIKRSPKAKIVRRVFEVPGPAAEGAMPLDSRARQIYGYFKNYNYELKATGDVIRFVGKYQASKGQAAALVFYVFCGRTLASVVAVSGPLYAHNRF